MRSTGFLLDLFIILCIFVGYLYEYRKVRVIRDWTGLYISYMTWEYYPMSDDYYPKLKRKYLWRPKNI